VSRLHFTDLAIARLKEPGEYHDDATLGFAIRVGKNRKTWFIIRGRQRVRTNVGQYPDVTLADARKEAKMLLTQTVTKYANIKLSAAYDLYKEVIATKKPRTQRDYKRIIDKYLISNLGSKKLSELVYEDFAAITKKLPFSEAGHCMSVSRTFLRWCVKPPRRFIAHSPLEGVEVKLSKKRKRVLKAPEIKTVWAAAGAQGYPHGTIVRLLILNGQRKSEIANLRWSWINTSERLITLPDWICKNSKEHIFPYGDMTAAIFEDIPHLNSTELLFPSIRSTPENERPISGWSKYKKNLNDGLPPWRLHDLRRTFRTVHGQIGTPAHIAERLINHTAGVQTEVEAIYDIYTYLPEMRAAVERYEAHINTLLA
jgi:integrase